MSDLRIVLAEDSVLLREGLVRLLADAGREGVQACGDAHRQSQAPLIPTLGRKGGGFVSPTPRFWRQRQDGSGSVGSVALPSPMSPSTQ